MTTVLPGWRSEAPSAYSPLAPVAQLALLGRLKAGNEHYVAGNLAAGHASLASASG